MTPLLVIFTPAPAPKPALGGKPTSQILFQPEGGPTPARLRIKFLGPSLEYFSM